MGETITIDVQNDERVLAVGRCPQGEKGLLCWTGSSLVIQARLLEWSAVIEADWIDNSPFMGILVDGVQVVRFALGRGTNHYTLLTGMDETVEHELTLFRETQPMSGEDRLTVRVLEMNIAGELLPVKDKPMIEFIGDSLTTGEGTVGPREGMEWRSVWISGMNTWAQTLCRELDARGEWISQSGWGIFTSWDNQPDCVLPRIYESVAAHSPYEAVRYDFAAHPVRAVIINLGTNDSNALNSLSEEEKAQRLHQIQEATCSFLHQIHRCRPGTPALFVYGMCEHSLTDCLRSAVLKDAENSSSMTMFMELPVCSEEELGSRGHPGPEFHRRCALMIAEKLRSAGIF